ncbi:MAG TPA: MerR family transcriptional regulator [Ilumatobacteraceae bacterium]|nr:MerR family transcriptional regulator [Ilumatobacteraceae bacterium]
MTIKDVAARSGFSAATLRYYEEIGLVPEPARTPAGYRMYDADVLARLAFIARAKQLGCSLDEIGELATAWEGGRCGPVQDRLRVLVGEKLEHTHDQIAALMTLSGELQRAAAALERHRPEGPCDDTCGCVAEPEATPPSVAVPLGRKPAAGEEPIACTLEPDRMAGRLGEWHTLLGFVAGRNAIDGGIRLDLADGTPMHELATLVAAEQRCCSFFRFAITIDARGVALEVTAPDDARPLIDAMFGVPA